MLYRYVITIFYMKKNLNNDLPIFSIFGSTGFIGSRYCEKYSNVIKIRRDERIPRSKHIIYFISSVNSNNVLDNELDKDIDNNLKILMDVLKNCKTEGLVFNFISSCFVYGDCLLPASEDTPCNPKGFYSITKRCAEQLLISFCQTFDINFRILRISSVYGKSDNKVSKNKNAIQYLLNELKHNREITLFDNGENTRDLMHVDDVCDSINLIVTNGPLNEIFNVGSGTPTKIRDVIEIAKDIFNSSSKINSIPSPKFAKLVSPKNFYMNIDKLNLLGFKQRISLKDGISQLCQ